MASHVIGPFLVASEPLTDDIVTRMAGRTDWGVDIAAAVPPFAGPQVVIPSRPRHHLGRQQGTAVALTRVRPEPVLLPPRHLIGAVPWCGGGQTFTGSTPPESEFLHYGEGWYGEGWYGE